jgi:hypothetical protein
LPPPPDLPDPRDTPLERGGLIDIRAGKTLFCTDRRRSKTCRGQLSRFSRVLVGLSGCARRGKKSRSDDHWVLAGCCKGNPKATPPVPPTPEGAPCPHVSRCPNCQKPHATDDRKCNFWRHRFDQEWINKGLIKAMSQVQHTAVRWICGNFRTTPGGGAECLSGLLPMHLTLRHLADRGVTRVPMLARSHPLRTILGEAMEGCHQAHPLALANSGPLSVTSLQGAAVDMAVGASALWQDEYDPFGPDSQPGNHVVDLFQSHFHRHGPASKKDEDIAKYRDQLDLAWAEAYVDNAS